MQIYNYYPLNLVSDYMWPVKVTSSLEIARKAMTVIRQN
jgi:hypothetical protein